MKKQDKTMDYTVKDVEFMRQAMNLAARGKGGVNPNPLVGAIIVKNDQIVAQGWHKHYGESHAEVNAFKDADENNIDVKGATMYVTLEPCSHYGKTPPCAVAIIERKISRVVIGQMDPNPIVGGRGIAMLKDAGIEVVCGVLEDELKYQNRIFLNYVQHKTPWVIMKTASTLDGKISTYSGDSRWVTDEPARKYVHELRNELQAIMVGVDTVIYDNPELTCRIDCEGRRNPIRIVVDSTCRIPLDSKILDTSEARTIIATTNKANQENIELLKQKGVEVILTKHSDGKVSLGDLMQRLGYLGIDGVLLEGGGTLNFSALEEGVVDEVMSFVAPKIIGGNGSMTSVAGKGINLMKDAINLSEIKVETIGNDILIRGLIIK
ncbi:bifunctional diaminohydroxyphosphoribosylaminopyrimidine deaminase/5-amino-6-(5-phosphoribosylamino)uracil reductase RibD [Marinilabiliaceae bacterium JC040]|nr:bifunctional diaminohydroxyphosphoribosylaminopyrimidine deaminase/5-amino-6-(5-phosphoribosylamino)uracil reductase RibD [Marinilabiliaceae bacterium JC040]